MVAAISVLSLLLTALVLTTALAHALELPGKIRLPQDTYMAVQQIYYPGFTYAGVAEPLAILCVAVQALAVPRTASFPLMLVALAALVAVQAIYWIAVHPVNRVWLKDVRLGGAGRKFFETGAGATGAADWRRLRDRWEYSHLARAAFAVVAFVALAVAHVG
jgi:hypothetical protein